MRYVSLLWLCQGISVVVRLLLVLPQVEVTQLYPSAAAGWQFTLCDARVQHAGSTKEPTAPPGWARKLGEHQACQNLTAQGSSISGKHVLLRPESRNATGNTSDLQQAVHVQEMKHSRLLGTCT